MATEATPKTASRKSGGLGEILRVRVELWLVVLFMAMAFGAGILVKAISEPPAQPVVGTQVPGTVIAPPLTDDQISAGLPSGHPDLSGSGGGQSGSQGGTKDTQGGSGTGGGDGSTNP